MVSGLSSHLSHPDSRFSRANGGPSDVPSLRMSATRSDRGETAPGDAFVHCCDVFCLASKFVRDLCRRLLRRWRLGFRHLLKVRRTDRVCETLEPPIHLHRWSSRKRLMPDLAKTSIVCVCCAGVTLPEPLPKQRQRKKHRTPADANRIRPVASTVDYRRV